MIANHDWNAFAEVVDLVNHWDRPGWEPGRRRFYWFITTENALAVHSLTARCQQALSMPELDLTPPDGLHITLSRITEVDEAALASVAAEARARCALLEPFTLQVLPLAGSRGAVRFSLAPWTQLLQLHNALGRPGAAAREGPSAAVGGFRPHLGIGYCNRPVPAEPLRKAVAGLRYLEPAELPVRSVELVELRRDHRRYSWTTLDRIRLGG